MEFTSHTSGNFFANSKETENEKGTPGKILNHKRGNSSIKQDASNKLWIPIKKGVFESVYINDIVFVVAQDHYVRIQLTNEKCHQLKSSLNRYFEKYLENFGVFEKISRSYIVNLRKIQRVENNYLVMENDHRIHIPRERKESVLQAIGIRDEI